jgi:hypothetical protein
MRLATLLCLLPLPALAQLPAPISAALDACMAEGQSLAARADALTAQGWEPLAPADRSAAAQAQAIYELVRMNMVSDRETPLRRAELLIRTAEYLVGMFERENTTEIWLSLPDGAGFLVLQSRIPTVVECRLVADLPPDLLAAAFEAPADVREFPPMTLTVFLTGENSLTSPNLITFAPGTFGNLTVLPLLTTPPVKASN